MQLLLRLLPVSLLTFSWVLLSRATPWQESDRFTESKAPFIKPSLSEDESVTDDGVDIGRNRGFVEDADFEDYDSSEDLMREVDSQNLNSVRHLHRNKGEVLIPCFGMWWPVGGSTYDYIDYYGDYKRKKRRSRKQKKAARMKRKKKS